MATFKIYSCSFGVKIEGVSYTFPHVMDMKIEDPENTKLVRGANAGNKTGLIYKDGLKDAKKLTMTIIGMTADIYTLLKGAYDNQTRVDVFCIDNSDGSSKIGTDSIMAQMPQQLSVDESTESMNVALAFETFNLTETHKN